MKPHTERWRSAFRSSYLFSDLDDATFAHLAVNLVEKEVPAGELVVAQGEDADALLVIIEGQVDVLREGDETVALRRLGPGGVIGELPFLAGRKRPASVRALETTRLAVLSHEAYERLLDEHPEMTSALSRVRSERMRVAKVGGFLQELFGPLSPDAMSDIERQVTLLHLASGHELFHQGDRADGAYIVVVGRLRVVVRDDAGGERVIDEPGRGQWVGEMALLTGKDRSATVYALRDTELMWLSEAAFDSLITNHPGALRVTTRALVSRMQRQMSGERPTQTLLKTLAIVPARSGVQIGQLTSQLVAVLRGYESVLHLTADKLDEHLGKKGIARAPADDAAQLATAPWLIEQEERHGFIVYQADDTWTPWTERAVRYADHILVVADGSSSSELSETERRLASCFEGGRAPKQSLVLLQEDGRETFPGTAHWLNKRQVYAHHHVRRGVKPDVARLARILTGKAICVVLGGGGSRGYAHIGVLRAFDELGIPIDAICGTSIGALIAAAVAIGMTWQDMIREMPPTLTRGFLDVTLPVVALLSGKVVVEGLKQFIGTLDVEDMATPLFCISTNLTRGGEVVHRRGSAVVAVRASTSIPGVFPPVPWNGDLLVDGGVANNVPVDTMLALFGGAVVASDVMPEVDLEVSGDLSPAVSGWAVARRRLNPFSEQAGMPDILNILVRSATAASHSILRAEASAKMASLYLRPPVTGWNIVNFQAAVPLAEEGYRGTIAEIQAWWTRERATLLGRS